ncbi:MAG: outer membrane beta-barrel protein [Pseudomonadota bacterium]
MFKNITTAASLAVLLSTAPALADGHAKPYTWTGVYLGVHGGQAFGGDAAWTFQDHLDADDNKDNASDRNGQNCEDVKNDGCDVTIGLDDSAVFGGHIGVQRQFGRVVAGFELSYTALDLEGTAQPNEFIPNTDIDADDVHTTTVSDLFTVAAKLGYVLGNKGRWLVYGKAGVAIADVATEIDDAVPFNNGSRLGNGKDDQNHIGFLAGLGVEYMLTRNIVVGAEYNFMTFGSETHKHTFVNEGVENDTVTDDIQIDDIQTIKARIGVKF